MPAFFEQGFMVRKPAWHGMGEVLEDYPGREEAMRIAGHDFQIIEKPVYVAGQRAEGWKAIVKDTDDSIISVAKESYGIVQNDVPWDIVDAIVSDDRVKYESAGVLKGGALCWVLAWLTEPVTIKGDDSQTFPFICGSWSHDGSGSVRVRSTSVRVVCANTEASSEAQAKAAGTDFTFRHSKNVMDRIADAKDAIQGVQAGFAEYVKLSNELAELPITPRQRDLFVTNFLPMPARSSVEFSDRVAKNVEEARGAVRALFSGQTIPEAHRFTAYGLQLAGVEYLDHIRGYRADHTRFGRSLLRDEPAKAKLAKLIRETVAA